MDLAEARARGFEASIRHPWETARIEVVGRLLRDRAAVGRQAVVLDIGCGDTFVVEQLAAEYQDATFYAVDTAFTEELVERYTTRLNNPRILLFESLDAIPPPITRPANLILLMDVIEHIEQDRAFLIDLCRRPFIGSNTHLFVTVPAYQGLFSSHDSFLGHYRRYSNDTLRRCLEASGLKVIDIGYFFSSLVPIRLVQVARERLLGMKPDKNSSGLVTWNGRETAASLMRDLLVLDARVSMLLTKLGLRLPGLSNYAICVKSA